MSIEMMQSPVMMKSTTHQSCRRSNRVIELSAVAASMAIPPEAYRYILLTRQ